ncbi:MAG: response regulator [Treponema sp.]|nr:response regulator [Treponema sp.]MBR6912794.1 response regulator [Treponema sp.]
MAKVLIVDAAPIFRDFITDKLEVENIQIEFANERDAYLKLNNIFPDLIILNIKRYSESAAINPLIIDFLKKKIEDKNMRSVPVIVTGPQIEKEEISQLLKYGMIKYFKHPIKYDALFDALGRVLKKPFAMDTTPSVMDVHLNNNIIFIEVAMGLNREKIFLLRYKIEELIEKNGITIPKVILMMTSLSLSFVDGMNLEFLFDTIKKNPKISNKNIKVLTLDDIVAELVEGHEEYKGIEVAKNLSTILNSLVVSDGSVEDVISDNILSVSDKSDEEDNAIEMRFTSDSDKEDALDQAGSTLSIAIVDDDNIIRILTQKAFLNIGATSDLFASGKEFVEMAIEKREKKYDLIMLDIFMDEMDGFTVLELLKKSKIDTPVIIYSQAFKREMIVKALSLGARSYLLKPQKAEAIIQKAMEVLNAEKK